MSVQNGLINAILLDGKGGGRQLDWSGVNQWTPNQGAIWIHLDFTTDEAQSWLGKESGLDPLIIDALIADETRPRCSPNGDGLLVSLRGVNSNPGADPEDMVSIRLFCTGDRIISTRRRHLLSIRDMVNSLEQGKGPRTTSELIAMLADRLVERMSDVINGLEERIDDIEEMILDRSAQEIRRDILELRREIIKLRRYLAPQRDALSKLHTQKVGWIGDREQMKIREAYDKITRYVEDLDSARDRAGVTSEELSGRMAEQMNTRMYLLSIIAGIFLPLGFLTGLLGINVGGIPLAQSAWGFFIVVLFLAVVVIGEVILFKRKKWF
ncbi:MAG: zinc transporter ZntB [Gammaproteobacteria bacterium]|nr:zinc transporter ZntB [Gammaproteobacteria bacterium]